MHIQDRESLSGRFFEMTWGLIILLSIVSGIGVISLYSAGDGSFEPWAGNHFARYLFSLAILLAIAMTNIRVWFSAAYVAYGLGLLLLLYVDVMGHIGMGAQRWINLGVIKLQPSELMKIATTMALAKFFHTSTLDDVKRPFFLVIPILLVSAPVLLVMIQPDLGTALKLLMVAGALFWIAGVAYWMFGIVLGLIVISLPIGWGLMHDYQRQRVLTFLNPESDPLGSGYHITQSKIALGSGGIFGKGFLEGTQAQLDFLPEKQTDFVFTLWAEETGFVGGVILIALYALIIIYGYWMATRCRHSFGRYVILGVTINFSLYVMINMSMVMGLIPVVGVPLPLVSHGGTAMLAIMAGFGLAISSYIDRDVRLSRGAR